MLVRRCFPFFVCVTSLTNAWGLLKECKRLRRTLCLPTKTPWWKIVNANRRGHSTCGRQRRFISISFTRANSRIINRHIFSPVECPTLFESSFGDFFFRKPFCAPGSALSAVSLSFAQCGMRKRMELAAERRMCTTDWIFI